MCFSLKIVHIYGNFDINSYEKAQSAFRNFKINLQFAKKSIMVKFLMFFNNQLFSCCLSLSGETYLEA